MPRAANPFSYQSPVGDIGTSLVRAFFGDPVLAEKQRQARAQEELRQAQEEEARAHAGLYTSQTTGQDGQNAGSAGLPALFKSFLDASVAPPMTPETTPITSVSDPRFLAQAGQPMPEAPHVDEAAQRSALAALLGGMGQAQGDKLNINDLAGFMGGFGGGDEFARRGMAAQGVSPTKDFAITPERADAIAAAGYAADKAKADSVATINNRDDIPVANIAADASRYRGDVAAGASRYGADTRAASAAEVAGIKAAGPAPGFEVIQKSFPGATMNSGERSPAHNRDVGGVDNSYHVPGRHPGAQAYDIPAQPGMTVQQAAAKIMIDNPGVRVVEALAHRAKLPDGSQGGYHWHFALQSVGKPGGKTAKPTKINSADAKLLDKEVDAWLNANGFTSEPKSAEGQKVKSTLRAKSMSLYQSGGDPVGAVASAATELKVFSRKKRDAGKPAPAAGGVATLKTDAEANAFFSNPANRGKEFIGPDGKRRKVP